MSGPWRADEASLVDALHDIGYLRIDPRDGGAHAAQREWLHFVITQGPIDLAVNFSLLRHATEPGRVDGNALLLLRRETAAGPEWEGDLDAYPLTRADVGVGGVRLRMGPCTVDYDGGFVVRARCRRRALSVDLRLVPETRAYLVHNVALDDDASLHWVVAPRLRASGEIRLAGEVVRLRDAVAYHDHNWGRFSGAQLNWEWACSLVEAPPHGAPWSMVYVRVLDRLRAAVSAQGLLVWEGASRRQIFRGEELRAEASGWHRGTSMLRVPRALSLLAQGPPNGVPRAVSLHARAGADHLEGSLTIGDVARVLVPRETDLRTTIIHEAVGALQLSGTIDGAPISMSGRAFSEFLGEMG